LKENNSDNNDNNQDLVDNNTKTIDSNHVPEKKFTSGSLRGSTISMVGTILSAGTITLPYAFKQAGVIPSVIIFIAGWWISCYCSKILVKCSIRS